MLNKVNTEKINFCMVIIFLLCYFMLFFDFPNLLTVLIGAVICLVLLIKQKKFRLDIGICLLIITISSYFIIRYGIDEAFIMGLPYVGVLMYVLANYLSCEAKTKENNERLLFIIFFTVVLGYTIHGFLNSYMYLSGYRTEARRHWYDFWLLSAIQTSGHATVTMENGVVHDKFAVYGNHDYGGGLEHHYRDIMEASGFHVLINETVTLDRWDLTITGIDDMVIGYGDPSCAEALPEDSYNIVLSHVPDICTELSDDPVDLMLSGHTHGGQITVPLLSDYVLPPYGRIFVRGEYPFENERNMMLYVNRGLGTTKLPLRFLASPELTAVILK